MVKDAILTLVQDYEARHKAFSNLFATIYAHLEQVPTSSFDWHAKNGMSASDIILLEACTSPTVKALFTESFTQSILTFAFKESKKRMKSRKHRELH